MSENGDIKEIKSGVSVISKESAISIGLGIVILAAALFTERRMLNVEHSLDLIRTDVALMRRDLTNSVNSVFGKSDARETFREMQRLNPEIAVPDPGNGNMPFGRTRPNQPFSPNE